MGIRESGALCCLTGRSRPTHNGKAAPRSSASPTMAQVQTPPDTSAHTDFVFSLSWEAGDTWIWILLAFAVAAAVAALLLYRPRRRK
jgi:hypothetical protein